MIEMNKVLLAGNLTRDPELKYLPSGTAIADLGLAVNRRMFDRNTGERKEETIFIDVTAWEKTAEFCKNYLHKGSGIFVEGRLKMDRWEDKQSGQARTKLTVVAERIQFADSKPQQGGGDNAYAGGGNAYGGGASEPAPQAYQERSAAPAGGGAPKAAAENTEDDLPF
jgi:single-strand DNA-binding protein